MFLHLLLQLYDQGLISARDSQVLSIYNGAADLIIVFEAGRWLTESESGEKKAEHGKREMESSGAEEQRRESFFCSAIIIT